MLVAPYPAVVGLCGGNYRVAGFVEVAGGVLVGRAVAAVHLSAGLAKAQVHPGIARSYAYIALVVRGGFHFGE